MAPKQGGKAGRKGKVVKERVEIFNNFQSFPKMYRKYFLRFFVQNIKLQSGRHKFLRPYLRIILLCVR